MGQQRGTRECNRKEKTNEKCERKQEREKQAQCDHESRRRSIHVGPSVSAHRHPHVATHRSAQRHHANKPINVTTFPPSMRFSPLNLLPIDTHSLHSIHTNENK